MTRAKRVSAAATTPAARSRFTLPGVRPAFVRHTLKDEVYALVCEALMSGSFAPGERLTVRGVAELTRTSVMPVREAFRRLISEGALEPLSSGATRVPVIDAAEFREITTLRLSVEGLAARQAAERIQPQELEELEAAHARVTAAAKKRDIHAEAQANEAFHFIVYRAARSKVLLQIIRGLWLRIGPVLITVYNDVDRNKPSRRVANARPHVKLVAALRAGKPEAAEKALREDLSHAAVFYLSHMQ